MFDPEQSIADWRKQMLAAGIKTPVPLEELESHLREEIERQTKLGVDEQLAFEMATTQIGQAGSLRTEFKKAGNADKAQQRKRAGFIFAALLVFYSLVITCILSGEDFTFDERLSGFASLAAMFASVFISWQILPRFFPVIASKTVQSAIGIIGTCLGMGWFLAFACFILPRCDFTLGQLQVAVFWAIVPVMVLPAISFLVIDKSERQQSATTSS
jgi:hypothetical protein